MPLLGAQLIEKENINKINIESKQYMAHPDKKHRKIKSGKMPFSLDSILLIKRRKTYRTLMGYHAGNEINKGNLKRAARQVGICNQMKLSIKKIRKRLEVCREKCKYYKPFGRRYRKQHLNKCLNRANKNNNEEYEKKILAIIQQKKDR